MSFNLKSICLKLNIALTFMLICLTGKAQYDFKKVDQFLLKNEKALGNDMVTLIYKDGKLIYEKSLGDFNTKSRAPIASCSKWLTSALVMTYVDEGKILLDERISDYLPIFNTYGKGYITIGNCLTQTTGIEDNSKTVLKILSRKKFETLDEEVSSFAKKEIDAKPGTSFFYGNMGLNIAGRILEIISKKSFESLIKQRLFTPLEMYNSSFSPEENAVNPSGGAASTAGDYMNFLSMLLNKGMYKGKRILSENAVAAMLTVQTKNAVKKYVPNIAQGYEYGLGAWIEEQDNNGKGIVVSCPGLFGTVPYIDQCRGYACIFFISKLLSEQKKDLYQELKKLIDEQIKTTCQ